MNANIVIIVLGCLGIGGSLMPLVESGMFNVGIGDLSGLAKLLHVVPVVLIVVGLLAAANKLDKPNPWYLAIGTTGVALCLIVSNGAMQHLEYFQAHFGELGSRFQALAPPAMASASKGLASGGWLLMLSFAGSALVGLYGVLARTHDAVEHVDT